MRIEVRILLPWTKDGSGVANDWAEQRACALFGGCTWERPVSGLWRDDTGETIRDEMRPLMVAVDSFGDLALCLAFARECRSVYDETCIYMSALGASDLVE